VYKHLPDNGVTPIVRLHLRVDGEAEIVVPRFQYLRNGHHLIKWDANQILSQFFEGNFESCFVIFSLAHGVADDSVSVSNKK